MNPIRVVLADDHAMVRAGIRALLERLPGIEVVGEADNGRAALEQVRLCAPHVVLLDVSMAQLGGLEALPRMVRDYPAVKVVILSGHANEEYVLRALRHGAAGYLVKEAAAEELGLAVQAAAKGKVYLSPSVSHTVVASYLKHSKATVSPLEQLSARQRQILQLIAEGHSTKEMAGVLGISVKTAEAHRAQLMDRLGIHDIAGLVRYALRTGLVSDD